MPRFIIVSRNAITVRWLLMNLCKVDEVQLYLETHLLRAGDRVYGQLAADAIHELKAMGVRYFHWQLELPVHLQGMVLNDSDVRALKPQLMECQPDNSDIADDGGWWS
jgi:putative CRISPR-associated protein (TIGR02620 family)